MSLKGKTAVVTGGASGIGLAISQHLARDGANIAIWDVNPDAAQKAAEGIISNGGQAMACKVDISKRADVDSGAKAVRDRFGPIQILVNNAGISGFSAFRDIDDEAWDRIMSINLKGPFLCTQAVMDDMVAANWGRIINISSSSARAGTRRMAHYIASKGGVIGLTKALAQELGPNGITVNNVPPGFVITPMTADSATDNRFPDGIEAIEATIPVRRAGRPEDIATAVAFLASEEAGYITGHTLDVNGGRYMS